MAFQNFVDKVGPIVSAEWLNLVDLLRATVNTPETFVDGDTTPSVESGGSFYTNNTAPTSITTFDGGRAGQVLEIICLDANTTFVDGATLKTNTGSNVASGADRIWRFKYVESIWYMF